MFIIRRKYLVFKPNNARIVKQTLKSLSTNQKISNVVIDHNILTHPTDYIDLSNEIDKAFGNDGSGILVIQNIPNYAELRKLVLPYAQKIANLTPEQKLKIEQKDFNYHRGWNQGRETHNGILDKTKASFYANVMTNNPKRPKDFPKEFDSYLAPNIWPAEFPEFENKFNNFAKLITDTGLLLLKHIDKYIYLHYKKKNIIYKEQLLYSLLQNSENFVGRLLHYFPNNAEKLNWLEWHYDHSLISGLTSGLFLDKNGNEVVNFRSLDPEAGLYINTRKGEIRKVEIPSDCLAFQIGEVAQILTGGLLKATAHYVNKGKTELLDISRNTLAIFMEPEWDEKLYLLEGIDKKTVFDDNNLGIPKLESRFENGQTFLDFSNRAFTKNQFY